MRWCPKEMRVIFPLNEGDIPTEWGWYSHGLRVIFQLNEGDIPTEWGWYSQWMRVIFPLNEDDVPILWVWYCHTEEELLYFHFPIGTKLGCMPTDDSDITNEKEEVEWCP